MKSKLFYTLAAVVSLALISTVAIAKRFNEVEYTYYNSKGKVVGGKTYYCGGGQSQWGIVTAFHTTSTEPC